MKRMILIVPVSKKESMFIRRKLDVHISRPTTNGRRYMEERPDAMRLLKEYRDGKYTNGGRR